MAQQQQPLDDILSNEVGSSSSSIFGANPTQASSTMSKPTPKGKVKKGFPLKKKKQKQSK